jgi:phosphoribosylformylglycinamidine synthase
MAIRIEVGYRPGTRDPRGEAVREAISSFFGFRPGPVRTVEVYTVDAPLAEGEVERVRGLFTDAVTQQSAVDRLPSEPFEHAIAVGFRAGVTDAEGRSAQFAVQDLLGRKLPEGAAVYCSRLYFLTGVSSEQAAVIATGLLANPLIERAQVMTRQQYEASEPDRSVPALRSAHSAQVQQVDLGGSDEALVRISRERILSLTLEEMRCIREQFSREDFLQARAQAGLGASPTDVELECLAQTWSEHCKHKIFNAAIDYEEAGAEPAEVLSPFREHIRLPTERIREQQIRRTGKSWLVSVFHDNAGVIAFNERWHLVYKVETHNSPSALDPYGGAMTGIVGVNRDPFGTGLGAELLSNVWGYCLADPRYTGVVPQGLMHPRRIRDGVHRGVIDGGNQSGIPYGRGWEVFDERFLGKPLVYCGTVGRMPVRTAGRAAHEKQVLPGDRIVMCGGRIGKDGIHGATFSSAELDESSPVQAVQIGDPITQKRMFDFLLEARDLGLYCAITDNGAGGLSSSVGELCQLSGGARMELAHAPLKYGGLDPWEVLISEAQERMTLAVHPEKLPALLELAARREVEATDLGEFTDSGVFELRWQGRAVGWLPLAFLHDGLPRMRLRAVWQPTVTAESVREDPGRFDAILEEMLRGPNLASGEKKARHYDHEVKGLTVVRPYVGVKADVPSDAAVFLIEHGNTEGYVLSEGINPFYSDLDTRWMTASVIDEAVRKAVGTGARLQHLAGLDNYCWPDPIPSERNPDGEYKLGQLVRSTRALAEFCEAYGVPCISGKDSMKNDSMMGGVRISIPPTLLFSVIGRIDDVRKAVTLQARQPGARVYLLGITRHELGGSELHRATGGKGGRVPTVEPSETLPLYAKVEEAIDRGLLQSCHSPARGGLAVALARVAMAGELGLSVDLGMEPHAAQLEPWAALFSESNGRYVVTVGKAEVSAFEALMAGQASRCIGEVTAEARLRVWHGGRERIDAAVGELKRGWKETFDAI